MLKLTLGQVFTLSLLGLVAALGLLFSIVFHSSQRSILESSERIRDGASREIVGRVEDFLALAPEAVKQFQAELDRGLVDPHDPKSIEPMLLAPLLANESLGEVTLTYGNRLGYDRDGEAIFAAAPRGQISAWRVPGAKGDDQFWIRFIRQEGGRFVAERIEARPSGHFFGMVPRPETGVVIPDPTLHGTFTGPSGFGEHDQLVWSDLHWSQLDAEMPETERRVEVSAQQVVHDAAGNFLGVLRVGLLTPQLDRLEMLKMTPEGVIDPHRIFICDAQGRLITRGVSADRLQENKGDLRVAPEVEPKLIASALADPELRAVSDERPSVAGEFRFDGQDYLTTFRMLPGTQDWILGIVVPRSFYLGRLAEMRDRLLLVSLGIMTLLVAGGWLILRGVKRGQAQIVKESLKMNAFEFSAAPTTSAFRDVSEVLESLETAKTAMRALGKYAPIDLVRRLYCDKSEPMLGGESMEVSLMFTDIKDFTALSERLAPNDLATALGRYLEVMARIIQRETRGTIDKYIGDAIMTIWNAPEPVPDHARLACLAALRCREAGRELARSPQWQGLPPFETRFGLHCDTALVGHFGAPDRMNYTAIGDAVNLASRLEGLNKTYGTTIIASERIVEAVRGEFDFRLLDRVAVKGKHQVVRIHELLGSRNEAAWPAYVVDYERALDAYATGDFRKAMAILESHHDDPPSVVLRGRCGEFLQNPPEPDWSGVYVATTK